MDGGSGASETTLGRPFPVTTKPTGAACNLECELCYYVETSELYPETSAGRMSAETLEASAEQYSEAQPGSETTFAWQGGDPALDT